jgi:hypothetical protein
MLRFEHHDHHSLEKLRETLRRAANIRRTLNISAASPQDLQQTEEQPANVQPLISQYSDRGTLKSVQRKIRLSRSNSFGVIKFPG